MLILLGGFRGSGKRALAVELARQHGLYAYNIRQHFLFGPPSTDSERIFFYHKVVQDLPLLSKMYPGVVLPDGLHRKGPREYLLSESKKYFPKIQCVWIESDLAHTLERLQKMSPDKAPALFENTRSWRARMELEREPDSMPTFHYSGPLEDAAGRLWELIGREAGGVI